MAPAGFETQRCLSLKGINVDYHIYYLSYLKGYAADIEEWSFTRLLGL